MITIHTKNIRIGMYVSGLDRPWQETPFLLQGFFVTNEKQIKQLQQLCQYVEVDELKSLKSSVLKAAASVIAKSEKVVASDSLEDDQPFVNPEPPRRQKQTERIVYEPRAALDFFHTFGTLELVKQNVTILTEGQKANRLLLQHNKMYLLVEGEISIFVASQQVGVIGPGEILGELTPLTLSARSATAVTNCPCKLISLDEKQFLTGLEQRPEFSLMLMWLLIKRLRQALANAKASQSLAETKAAKAICVFNNKMLHELVQKLEESSIIHLLAEQTIFRQGGAGILMYVILEGSAVVSIDDKIVERCGSGSVIGEITIIDQKQRLAHVIAETDCSLLAISRPVFIDLVKNLPGFGLSLLRALATRLRFCRVGSSE